MITFGDLALMQNTAASTLLTTPCTIQRNAPVSDGMGGTTANWATLSTPFCRVAPVRAQYHEGIDEGRLELLNRWMVYLPAGQDVTIRDRIVALGNTYEVVSIGSPQTIEITRVVECTLVTS